MIQAQVGHVAPEMMKTYSHIRRQALNQAAAALEPLQSQGSTPSDTTGKAGQARRPAKRVMSQSTSQSTRKRGRLLNFPRLAPQAGFEPATLRLTAGCSAVELRRNEAKKSITCRGGGVKKRVKLLTYRIAKMPCFTKSSCAVSPL